MLLNIKHSLHYQYDGLVFLNPHLLHLTPKLTSFQFLKSHRIEVRIEPSFSYKNTDAEGNLTQSLHFNEATDYLTIESYSTVVSKPNPPFSFTFSPFECSQVPFDYPFSEATLLGIYLERIGVTTLVDQFARQTAAAADWQTTGFLVTLCKTIKANFTYEKRYEGGTFSPETTLIGQKGTCRDYAVFFIACCRAMGLAARFVSGYCYGSPEQAHELHAWAEVYLPGGGWRGFDPTAGLAIDDRYVALASSLHDTQLAPVIGSFKGKAKASLETDVVIQFENEE